MRPLRLLLDGFGSYRQPAEADFTDVDFFALVGPTGSGKSTLIDGLCFALYGTVPRWGKQNVDLRRAGPGGQRVPGVPGLRGVGDRYAAVRRLTATNRAKCTPGKPGSSCSTRPSPADAPLAELLGAAGRAARRGPRPGQAGGPGTARAQLRALHPVGAAAAGPVRRVPADGASKRQELLVELLAFGVYEKVGQRARARARLAADRSAPSGSGPAGRGHRGSGRAAARDRDLSTLRQAVDDRLRGLGRSEQARQAAGGRGPSDPGRVAGRRPRAGRRGGPGRPDRRRRPAVAVRATGRRRGRGRR